MGTKKKPATVKSKRIAQDIARENRPHPTVGVSQGPGDPRITPVMPSMSRAISTTHNKRSS